jgi:hypothetical protein
MTLAARAPLALLAVGTASVAYGSIATMPRATEGQIVATVFVGAGLLLVGALHLATLIALRPARADALLEQALGRGSLARFAPGLVARTAFSDVPVLRWGLCLALLAVVAFAAALLASDVFAWTRLSWVVPVGAGRVILG